MAVVLLLSACGGGQDGAPESERPSPSPSASASPVPSPSTTAFTSARYGYTVTLPARWQPTAASRAWDGRSGVSSDSDQVDQFRGTYGTSSWGVAAPWRKDLGAAAVALVAATTRFHGDTCPARPEGRHRLRIGGAQGVLLEYDCGILINLAVVVHGGVQYQFGFRDPGTKAAFDPTDHDTFTKILSSVRFGD